MIAITFKSSEEALGKVVDLFKLHAVETHTFHGFSLPKMNVLTNEISVHNYLHFLLARLEPSPEYLKRLPTFLVLKIIDAPLTSLVFYAQESAGLWIRNGHFLKLSDCFYFQSKYHFLTSCLFDLDFFLVQLAFRSLPPALILPWVLDRFGFFNFDTKGLHWPYSMDVDAEKLFIDVRHKWSILESMLLLWIHSIVDATFAMSPEEKQHDILIHFLAFGSKSYVEITECLSDPTEADTASVEKKLAQVADFVSPPLSNEAGKYFLKEDVYQHINPFHKKYSRNQRTFLDEILKQKGIPLLVPKACIDPTFLIASEYVARFFTQVLLEENIPDVIVHLHFALFAILLNTPSKKFIPLGKPDQHPVIKFLEDHPSLFEAWRPHFAHEGYSMWVSNNLRQHAIHLFSKDNETLEDSNHASESFIDPSTLMDNVHKNDTKLHPSKKEIAMQRQHELMEQMKQQQLKFAEAFADEFSSDDAEEEVGLHLNNYGTERKDTHEVHTSSHSALSSKLLSPILGKSPRKEKKGMESPSSMDDSTMQLSSSSTVVIESKPSISKQETENCLVCHRSMLRTESYGFLVRFEASRFLKRQVVQDNLQFVELSNHIGFYASTCGHLVHEACLNITFSKTRLSSCPLCSRTCNAWIPAENSVFSKKFLDSIELVLQRAYEEYTSFYEDVTLFFLHSGPLSSTSPNPSQNAFYFLINTTLYTLHCVEIQLRFSQKNTSLIQLSFLRSLVCICQEIFKEMPLPLWMTSSVCFPSTLQTPPICCLDPFPKLFYNVLKTPSLWKQYLGSAYSEIHTLYPLQSDTSNLLTLIFLRKSYFLQTILFSSQLPSHLLSLDVSELAACLNIDYFSFIDNLKKIDRSKPTGSFTFSIDKLTPYSLFPLPNAYENLLLQKSQFVCPQCDLTPSSVGMCLICGQFVCLQGFCCMNPTTQKGEANTHKEVCSGEQGLFLDFSHNLIFILFLEHGRFLPHLALYLDSHGESKVREVHLGKPMYLSKTRFEQLQELWMKHDIGSLIEISQPHFTFNLFELRDRTIWHSF
ncbi:hypothetical protein HMI56_007610 [Coelomomyces lativittatus]|nr:hypothetical protein HMI56_007610 [Coelomomyces lativittatus]